MTPSWSDPYAKDGVASGERCPSTEPGFASARCVRKEGHKGSHRHTSAADGRSVTWDSPDEATGSTVFCSSCGKETLVPHAAAWPHACSCGGRSWRGAVGVTGVGGAGGGGPGTNAPEPPRPEKEDVHRDWSSLEGYAYGSNPADGHAHQWVRGEGGDFCLLCRIGWPDAMRGFGSNVAPPKQHRQR